MFRLEKENLRTTNTELMDRLKKIWTSYKEVLPSTSHHYSSDSDQINDKVITKSNAKLIFSLFLFLLNLQV